MKNGYYTAKLFSLCLDAKWFLFYNESQIGKIGGSLIVEKFC